MLTSFFGRLLFLLSAIIFCVIQSVLWMGDGGVLDIQQINQEIAQQKAENAKMAERNQILRAEVNDLKSGTEAIEEHARLDLGMVKIDETFFLVTAPQKTPPIEPTP
jgi:cell division protein FtsB